MRVARAYGGYEGYAEIRRLVLEVFARRPAFEGMGPRDRVGLEPLSGRRGRLARRTGEVQASLDDLSE